jgi:hypothetical protein
MGQEHDDYRDGSPPPPPRPPSLAFLLALIVFLTVAIFVTCVVGLLVLLVRESGPR